MEGGSVDAENAQPRVNVADSLNARERSDADDHGPSMSKLEEYWSTRKTFFTEEQHRQAWENTADIVKKSSDEMIERWNKEIDTLLVYAGLFSAILTAFNVQSYPLLTPASPDPVLMALQQISSQLTSFSVTSSFINATHPTILDLQAPAAPPPERWAVWLNALWFASLICSLSAASVGIMVKQWLNQYSSGLSGSSRQIARLRQHRLNALEKWCVGGIVAILPVLLQVGALLFFAGLLILLWVLNHTVAIIASALVGALATFLVATTVIPTFTIDCPYLSPASFAVCETVRPFFLLWSRFRKWLSSRGFRLRWLTVAYGCRIGQDIPLVSTIAKALYNLLYYAPDISLSLPPRGKELSSVAMDQTRLDGDMVATAYTVVMDLNYLDMAAVCFTDISPDVAALCFHKIRTQNTRHAGDSDRREHMQPSHPCMWSGVVVALLCCRCPHPYSKGESRPWSLDSLQTAIACLTYDDNDATFKACPGQWTPLLCSDYLQAIRSGNFDLGVKKRYDPPCMPPRDVPSLLLSEFSSWMERLRRSDIRLGADLRISIATGMAVIASPSSPLGWEARGVALHCLLECLPHPNSPEYNPADDGVTFRAIAHHANNALLHFANALRKVNSGLEDDSELVLSAAARVCGNLRRFEALPEYGEAAGFPPPQFMEAIHDYLVLWESREPDRLSKRPLFHQLRFRAMQKQIDAYRRGDRQRPFSAGTSGDADSVDDLLRVCLQEWNLGNIEPGNGQLQAAAMSRLTTIPETVAADGGLGGACASSLS